MDINTFKRMILRIFPEFSGNWHLPHFAKIVSYPELPDEGQLSDRFYPRYAANIQLLDEKLVARSDIPELQAVPLPINTVGENSGRLEPPAIGTIVEVAFAYANPDKPFIRTILPFGFHLPAIKERESRYQVKEGAYEHWDQTGSYTLECLRQKIIVLEEKLEEIGKTKTTRAQHIIEEAQTIKMNGDLGCINAGSICPITGNAHIDPSTTVFCGK